ncbi:hypothetical protein D3C80_1265210 [compost metagenome]
MLHVAGPQRVFVLKRRDRLHGVGAAQGVQAGFRQAEMPDLAGFDQGFHRLGDILHRHVGIDAVLIQKVDVVGAQPLQHGIYDGANVIWSSVQTAVACAGLQVDVEAELGGQDNLIAERFDGLAQQVFVGEGAIGLGRVEQGHAPVKCVPNDLNAVRFGQGFAIGAGQAHAAIAEGGDFQAGSAEGSRLHRRRLPN